MNRITSPMVFLVSETPPLSSELRPEVPADGSISWASFIPACSPFQNIDLESTVLSQVQKAFTCFNRMLNICCVDCQTENDSANDHLAQISLESAIDLRIFV